MREREKVGERMEVNRRKLEREERKDGKRYN